MAKSIKLKNDYYLNSSSVVHNKKLLTDILNEYESYPIFHATITVDNGYNFNNIINVLPNPKYKALIVVTVTTCSVSGAPSGAYPYGLLLCFKNSEKFSSFSDVLIYIPDSNQGFYFKTKYPHPTFSWRYIGIGSNIDDYD